MRLEFSKMHGAGNDFVVALDADGSIELAPSRVAAVCDRRFGVGADGLILVRPPRDEGSHYYMHYANADGTLAEMCGNGIRCLAKYVVDRDLVTEGPLLVDTLAGTREVDYATDGEGVLRTASVDMGAPVFDPASIPVDAPLEPGMALDLDVDGGPVSAVVLSMGNPHAILFVRSVADAPVGTLGPLIERHPSFPNGTNVEFVQVMDDGRLRCRVWERGVGETLACGTGACAAVVACVLSGTTGHDVTVELEGGALQIHWEGEGSVLLTGPAEEVFTGSMEL